MPRSEDDDGGRDVERTLMGGFHVDPERAAGPNRDVMRREVGGEGSGILLTPVRSLLREPTIAMVGPSRSSPRTRSVDGSDKARRDLGYEEVDRAQRANVHEWLSTTSASCAESDRRDAIPEGRFPRAKKRMVNNGYHAALLNRNPTRAAGSGRSRSPRPAGQQRTRPAEHQSNARCERGASERRARP